jgi:hypothetical protein
MVEAISPFTIKFSARQGLAIDTQLNIKMNLRIFFIKYPHIDWINRPDNKRAGPIKSMETNPRLIDILRNPYKNLIDNAAVMNKLIKTMRKIHQRKEIINVYRNR